ncbi:T9SS sorting signal type C domain-containing protein [Flavobacterium sp. GSB-24]|uniref:DUF7507 domain-containing protein n=1 Tax=Flavobacterium sp. GSB-24 TaxID=2994319 RepID=UPI002492E8A1|nr:T9SS sorting signal type C domain-containing protein [Flavobacterium sp. GSB-24]BDU23966.1 hypothetical protein FLGSB24_07100 [Flavobacterium sp. GSB-24]
MSTKKLLNFRSLSLKKTIIFFFLISLKITGQSNTITRIHTDWNKTGTGYWTSNAATGVGNRPDNVNNLLAFEWRGQTFSTGVEDNKLNTNSVSYNAQNFRALKIQTLGANTSTYFLQGSMIDGSATGTTLIPPLAGAVSTGSERASRLTDGKNGLSLGTGIANIPNGTAEFKIGTNNLNLVGINDNIPDLLVTQVAEPGGTGTEDIFKFVDAAGNTVGNQISVSFNSVSVIGTYSLDLFRATDGVTAFTPAATRDIRMLGIETSSFGITSANAAQVDRFVVVFSGSSDCAFIAFNTKSLKIADLSMIKKATLSSCGKAGDVITYNFDIKNTGQVPITNISVSDPMPGMVFSSNLISSLAVDQTATITATYTVTPADVAAGRIVNSATVTGTDPSLNTVTDISGDDYNNNNATITILLAPPTISAVHPVTCASLGSIDLTNLPASGTWQITQTGTASATYSGTGSTFTVPNLAVGSYSFRVNTGSCNSPATSNINVGEDSSTTWNGSSWSTGLPGLNRRAIIASTTPNQPFTTNTTICSLIVNSGAFVTIPSGVTLTITNSVTTNGQLIFENNSSLVQTTNAVNTGDIVYKRATSVRRYDLTYWSTPVTKPGFTLYNLSPDTLGDKFSYYDPNAAAWMINYNGTMVMEIGKSYNVRAPQYFDINTPSIFTAVFTGVPNNGDISVNTVSGKWNLIGNPFPSAIDADQLMAENPNLGSLYFWGHNALPTQSVPGDNKFYYSNDFTAYNATGTAGGDGLPFDGYIAAAQGFFAKPAAGTIIFNNHIRRPGNNTQFYKTSESTVEKNRLWLNMTHADGILKQALVGYVQGATNTIDVNYDAVTMGANAYIDFYSISESKKLTIQGRALPFDTSDLVPLGYKALIEGDFTIAIDHADGFFDTQAVYLEDKTTGKITDLRKENYTFKTAIGTFTDRFVLRYTSKTLGTDDFENISDGILVSVKNKVVRISSKEALKEVKIFDIGAQLLYSKNRVNSSELQISNLNSSDQALLVKITLENGHTFTKKIIYSNL